MTRLKENEIQITTEEYSMFLKFLLNFLQHDTNAEQLPEFCDMLFAKEYLKMLPEFQIKRYIFFLKSGSSRKGQQCIT